LSKEAGIGSLTNDIGRCHRLVCGSPEAR
jgi:hypothetical protein